MGLLNNALAQPHCGTSRMLAHHRQSHEQDDVALTALVTSTHHTARMHRAAASPVCCMLIFQ
jgi:hypothetical protein